MFPINRFAVSLLLFAALPACGPNQQEFAIRFAASYGNQSLTCARGRVSPRLVDLRFFVTGISLLKDDGSAVPLRLTPNTAWQNDSVALIDLEDGGGGCQNGTSATNTLLTGRAPAYRYTGLRFTLGVPEELNHGDPLIASAPLADTAMHWHWRSGYKFLRAGLQRGTERYRLHLGSARCRGVIGKLEGCDASNRAEILLERFDSERGVVVFDFAKLLDEFDPQDMALQDCEMGPDEAACDLYRGALGLDKTGVSIKPARIFRAEAGP